MKEQQILNFINEFPIPCSYHKIFHDASVNLWDCEFLCVNRAFEEYFQKKSSVLIHKTLRTANLLEVDSIDKWIEECVNVVMHKNIYDEILYDVKLGKWLLINVVPLNENDILIMYTDINDHSLNRMHIEDFFSANLELMCISNLNGQFLKVNEEFEHILGYYKDELEGKSFFNFIHKDDYEATMDALKKENEQKPIQNFINRYRCKDGSFRIIEWKSQPHGKIVYSTGRDITESRKMHDMINRKNEQLTRLVSKLKEVNDKLKHSATTDQLTGLFNRNYFDQKVLHEMERSDLYNMPLSMLIYDLDHFKQVNDDFGHPAGDEILTIKSAILKHYIREQDYAFRLGGEEFALLMTNTSLERAEVIAENIRVALGENIHPVIGTITASFGVAERIKGEPFLSWYKRIDKALYVAKNKGRNQVIAYQKHALPAASVQIEWNDDWDSGNNIIDSQHKELLELATNIYHSLFSNMPFESILLQIENLIDHLNIHFTEEETLLKEIAFSEFKEHKFIHHCLLIKLINLKEDFISGRSKASVFFTFILDEVITEHLANEDVKFFPFLS